jgi:O-glycosyl hydrolase
MIRVLVGAIMSFMIACDGGQTTGNPDDGSQQPEITGPIVPQPDTYSSVVSVDLTKTHQTMTGFGASMRIFSDPHLIGQSGTQDNALHLLLTDENAILDSVYKTIGLTRVRATIQSNGTQATPQSVPRRDWVFADGHIDLVKRAETRGLREWWISPVSLEPWMDKTNPSQYADWAIGEIRYWKSQGVELSWWSIANEPLMMGVSPEFIRDAVKLVGRQLTLDGSKTKLVIPDEVNPINGAQRARVVLSDPEARQYVGAIASHLYATPLSAMSDMAAVSADYNVPLWMSEFFVTDHSPMAWADIVHRLIATYNVSSVDYMWGFFGDWDQAQLVAIHQTSGQFTGLSMTPASYATAQYARFVLPGAKRVDATSPDSAVLVSAYVLNGKVTIVALNESTTAKSVRFSIAPFTGLRAVRLIRTSDTEKLAEVGTAVVTNGSFNLELPARSISTLVQ